MLDLIKKSIYLGLGVLTITKEKIEILVDELIEKGQISKEEKPKILQDIIQRINQEQKALSTKVRMMVKKAIDELGLVTKKDVEELNSRLEEIEKKVTKKDNI
jgi:polyhydroxyalkanoate synthesis regulator phasin